MGVKRYKYKREHFSSQKEYERFRERRSKAQKKWLYKREAKDEEHRERRILRQRLYSRYYYRTDAVQPFSDWLREKYHVADLSSIPLEQLRGIAGKS